MLCPISRESTSFAPKGSLLTRPGYDPETGFFLFKPPTIPAIPGMPGRADALAALRLLLDLLQEFPFSDEASRSVALSLVLSLVLRPALHPAVPLHVVTAPEAGRILEEVTPERLAAAARDLIAAPSPRTATRAYAERFDWRSTTDGQLALFREICERRSRRPFPRAAG